MVVKVITEEIEYKNFGKCIKLSNGRIEVIVTIEMGPRIIRFSFENGENIFFDAWPFSKNQCSDTDRWFLLGGHRLWHSPESSPRSYIPDNNPVNWCKIDKGIKVIQDEEKWTQILKEMEITFLEDNKVKVTHIITNKNAWPIQLSAWPISVMSAGGLEVIPQPDRDTGLLANRSVVLWPYSKMNDKRLYWGEKYITIKHTLSANGLGDPFKFGINNEKGWAAYFNNNNLYIKRYSHHNSNNYAEYGASYETYLNNAYVEMETLSPAITINFDENIIHEEVWELYDDRVMPLPNDEKLLDEVISNVLNG